MKQATFNLPSLDARAERLRSRKLFVTPKAVEEIRPAPSFTLPEIPPTGNENWAGKFERREGDIVFMWCYSRAKTARRGVRVGNIDRSLPTVLGEIDLTRLWKDAAYRKEIFNLVGLGMGEGMSAGKNIIYYETGDKLMEIFQARELDHRVKGANFRKGQFNGGYVWSAAGGADSDEWGERGISKELQTANKTELKNELVGIAQEAHRTGKMPEFDAFIEAALAVDPDATFEEMEKTYENLKASLEVAEQAGADGLKEISADEAEDVEDLESDNEDGE